MPKTSEVTKFNPANVDKLPSFNEIANSPVVAELDPWTTYRSKDEKAKLVGKPFVVLAWESGSLSSYEGDYVVLYCVGEDDRKFKVIDTGVGINEQIANHESANGTRPLLCRNGLSRSDYDFTDPATGKVSKATTFYLA